MDIVKCLNCEMNVAVSSNGVCPSCGLNVNERTTPAPDGEARAVHYQKDLRNSVWLLGVFSLLPMFAIMVLYLMDPASVRLDGIGILIVAYSSLLTLLALVSGILIGKGRRIGRSIAFIPCLLTMLNFPIGTAIGYWVYRKLSNPMYLSILS